LAKAEQGLANLKEPMGTTFKKTDEMPWQRAEAVVDQFRAELKVSSVKSYSCRSRLDLHADGTHVQQAFVILYAYKASITT